MPYWRLSGFYFFYFALLGALVALVLYAAIRPDLKRVCQGLASPRHQLVVQLLQGLVLELAGLEAQPVHGDVAGPAGPLAAVGHGPTDHVLWCANPGPYRYCV